MDTVQIYFNGHPRNAPAETTVAALLQQLQLEPRRLAVEVNERLVPREQHTQHVLRDGDRLEVVTIAGGG